MRIQVLTAKLQQFKRSMIALIKDFRPVWREQTPIVRQEMIRQFKTQNFGSWPPISKATKRWRIRHGYDPGAPPLQASGRLMRSIEGGPGGIELQQVKALTIGTNLNQAAPNQFGATVNVRRKSEKQKKSGRGRKSKKILYTTKIPARPFMPDGTREPFAQALSDQMKKFMDRYIVQEMAKPVRPEE